MSAAAILAIGLCAVDPSVLRANFSEAGTHAARIDAGLILLDDLLDRQWSKDLTVELAMIGLPDAERAEQARMLIDEVLVLTDAVDVAIRGAAGDGTRVKTAAARWRRARGLACAVAAILASEQGDRSVEALTHLGQAAAGRGDTSGRLRRMLAQVHLSRGEIERAIPIASEVVGGVAVTPLQRTLAEAILLRCGGETTPCTALAAAEAQWQVVLLGEAIMRASEHTTAALRWIGPIRSALERCGMSSGSHGALTAAMAARLGPPTTMTPDDLATLDPAAIMGAARVVADAADAVRWMESLVLRAGATRDRKIMLEAQAECLERVGDPLGAMRAWRAAAGVGGADSADFLDQAGRCAVTVLNAEASDDLQEARTVLEDAARNGSRRAAWMRSLAAVDAAGGAVATALNRLAEVPPAGPEHLQALRQIGQLLRDRCVQLGRWSDGDRDRLESARLAAVAAASQRADLERAAMAAPIAGTLAALVIEHQLDGGDLDAAARTRSEDEAIAWLSAGDRASLDVRIAAMLGDCPAVAAALNEQRDANPTWHDELVRRLVLWSGGPSLVDADRPSRPAALACLLQAMSPPRPAGRSGELLTMAEALARGDRCEWAVPWFDAALAEDASLLPAVLGRCECLRQSDDRAVLADVARGYRQIAALPREDDPTRWRLAQGRLLEVLRRAGADPARIEARLARLRAVDPLVGADSPRAQANRRVVEQ